MFVEKELNPSTFCMVMDLKHSHTLVSSKGVTVSVFSKKLSCWQDRKLLQFLILASMQKLPNLGVKIADSVKIAWLNIGVFGNVPSNGRRKLPLWTLCWLCELFQRVGRSDVAVYSYAAWIELTLHWTHANKSSLWDSGIFGGVRFCRWSGAVGVG